MEQKAILAGEPAAARGRVALLVDGDNLAAASAGKLILRAATLGHLAVRRVYADASHLRNWESSAGFDLRFARTGRNAADILLAMDAVDLAHRGAVSAFAIASSDRDFAPVARWLVARWLVERGFAVLGLGGPVASEDWRRSCTRFEAVGAAAGEAVEKAGRTDKVLPAAAAGTARPGKQGLRSRGHLAGPPAGAGAGTKG